MGAGLDELRRVRAVHATVRDHCAPDGAVTVEAVEWSNEEGMDVTIHVSGRERRASLTWAEADAVSLVIARLRVRGPEEE